MHISPVFNIADSSIFIGVVVILFCQRIFFKDKPEADAAGHPQVDHSSKRSSSPGDMSGLQGTFSEETQNKDSN